MTQPPERNYVAGSRPVNRRTASREALAETPVHPVVRERLALARARNRLGPALLEQIRGTTQAARQTPLPATAVAGGVVAAVGVVALFLAWLQTSWGLVLAGGAVLLTGLALVVRGLRVRALQPEPVVDAPPIFDDDCLQALDQALAQLAPEVPDAIAAQLTLLKQVIVRIARQGAGVGVDENFTMDDRLYLRECVRRYLPDTLQSYLAVPREQRDTPLAEGHSAAQLLAGQLDLLRTELEKREARLGQSAAGALLRQQRFLQSKSGR